MNSFTPISRFAAILPIALACCIANTYAATADTAPAKGDGPHQQVVKTFGDWSKICVDQPEGKPVCQVVQSANQNKSGRLVFQTAIGYVSDNDHPIMYLTAPLGIFLPKGVSIFVDDNPGLTATVQRCDGNGCLALLALKPDLVKQLETGKEAKLVFAATAKQNVSLPLSLDGFKAAFDSLEKPAKPASGS